MAKRKTSKIRQSARDEDCSINMPEWSEWTCYLFGVDKGGMVWTPLKGCEPNWFWRKMQFLILGNKWVKEKK
tara:strand:- start:755 stop:970 length:216 start_codon:yes stop_codon:yes gene_type:complete